MSRYCVMCGRELTKTTGPIGPKCLQKIRPKNKRVARASKTQQRKILAKYDIYGGLEGGQRKDDSSSEDIEEQEIGQDGEIGETIKTQDRKRRSQV